MLQLMFTVWSKRLVLPLSPQQPEESSLTTLTPQIPPPPPPPPTPPTQLLLLMLGPLKKLTLLLNGSLTMTLKELLLVLPMVLSP